MKRIAWKNKSNDQICITIPKNSGIKEGDIVSVTKEKINRIAYSHSGTDLFHYGHLRLIEAANELADLNICGVLTSEAITSYKQKPIIDLKERISIISALRSVDMVMIQRSLDPTDNLKKIHEQFKDAKIILVHGSDWKKIPGEDYVKKIGGEIVCPPYYEKLSEQKVLNKIFKTYGDKGALKHSERYHGKK